MLVLFLACSRNANHAAVATVACASCGDPRLPLELVAEVDLPGAPVRFDYQDIDFTNGHLVIAHMNDDSVDIVNLSDGSLAEELTGIPTARGVAVAPEVGLVFVTSSPDQVVAIDSATLQEVDRFTAGRSPDGIAWDGDHRIVGVSDQGDGALSLIADAGQGARTPVVLGDATGNVVYDRARGRFWITVEHGSDFGELVAVDPTTAEVGARFDLPGCSGAHGLQIHPDGGSAFVACEGNRTLMRVDLSTGDSQSGRTGSGPDVMALDPGLGWLYVAAEGGDLTIFDIDAEGVAVVGHDSPGDGAHTVAVDPDTHHLFFPLPDGGGGTPMLRIMRPRE